MIGCNITTLLTALLILAFALPAAAQMSPEEAMRLMQKKKDAAAASSGAGGATASDADNDARWKELIVGRDAYLIVPLGGEVLPKWTDTVKLALDRAKAVGVKHIVFVIDSPGGLVDEAESLAKLLQERDGDFETYAVVRRGISASIWPMFSCDHIYVTQGAMVGGALTFKVGATGAAQVDDKMNSVYAAHVASIAERKGHPAALARGMMLPDSQVFATGEGDAARITQRPRRRFAAGQGPRRGAHPSPRMRRFGWASPTVASSRSPQIGEANGLKNWHCVGMIDPGLAEDLRMAEGPASVSGGDHQGDQRRGRSPRCQLHPDARTPQDAGCKRSNRRAAMSDPSWHPRLLDEQASIHRVPSLLQWRRDVRESGAARRDAHRLLTLAVRSLDAALATVGESRNTDSEEDRQRVDRPSAGAERGPAAAAAGGHRRTPAGGRGPGADDAAGGGVMSWFSRGTPWSGFGIVMAEVVVESEHAAVDAGAYDVLHRRLVQHGEELRRRLESLNDRRAQTFGSIETRLLATRRVNTPHPCVPRDMTAVGRRFLFGFNVHFGLKTQIEPPDVFAQYRFGEDGELHAEPLTLIEDERFRKDFTDLYRFYKGATFAKSFNREPHLYMKFRIGRSVDDFKAFKFAAGAAASVGVFELDSGSQRIEDGPAEAGSAVPETRTLQYLDNRSDHEVRYPSPHDFEWKRAGRDAQRPGRHPHVAIDDRVFVETVGGDLTIKVEDSTDTGQGILSEPVEDPDQTLDDAEILYVVHGHLILLRVRPYNEKAYRHFIVNTKLQQAVRVDALEHACRLLPDDHGLIFANGFYLATGELQTFPNVPPNMVFERRVAAPNGEDFLYVFYNRESGRYALLSYNLIQQKVETPTVCNGFAILPEGELLLFRAGEEASRHHAIQVWQTPYVGPDHVAGVDEGRRQSFLYKVGNAEVVRGMAECRAVLALIERDRQYADLYVDIARTAQDLLDSYHWLDHAEAAGVEGGLAEPLRAIRDAAQAAVGEFEKVRRQRTHAAEQVAKAASETDELVRRVETAPFEGIEGFVEALASLRALRGRLIALREVKYVDAAGIEAMEQRIATQAGRVGHRAVEFLLEDQALDPYRARTAELAQSIGHAATVAAGREVEAKLKGVAADLELLIDTVSNLPIEDATQRTRIVDAVSDVFATVNAARSRLQGRIQELGRSEGVAEFNSQLKLLSGSVTNLLSLCDTPERCDELMTRALVQVEELEGRFAEFDEFVVQLAERREQIVAAFEERKLSLQERRNARTQALTQAADRVLRGVGVRAKGLATVEALAGFFAADVMVAKVRDLADELEELGDSVRAQGVRGQLKAAREEAVRRLEGSA